MNKNRPSWIDYYLGLAFFIAARSHDEETQHGCVICDEKHRPVGMGYNGFPAGIHEDGLPTTRPDKYPWMIHSEANAVNNIRVKIDGTTAFVTGQCCNPCIMNMYNNGVRTVYMADCHGSHVLKKEDQDFFDDFISRAAAGGDPMIVHKVKPNLNWIMSVVDKLRQFGFIDPAPRLKFGSIPPELEFAVGLEPFPNRYKEPDNVLELIDTAIEQNKYLKGYRFKFLKVGNTFQFPHERYSGEYQKIGNNLATPTTSGMHWFVDDDDWVLCYPDDLTRNIYQ